MSSKHSGASGRLNSHHSEVYIGSNDHPHRQHTNGSTIQGIQAAEDQHHHERQVLMMHQQPFNVAGSQNNSFSQEQHQQVYAQQLNRSHTAMSAPYADSHNRVYAASHEGVQAHMTRCVSPHHLQTAMDGRVCALGNQNQHGNTWVMSGANWMSTRQASPVAAHKIHNKCCGCKESSPAPYHVRCCENEGRTLGASAKMMSQTQASVMQRTQQMHATAHIPNATTNEFKNSKTNGAILLETKQAEDCGLQHMSKAMQLKLSQKTVDHTYRLFGSQLTFAKDVPTHTITDSESLRRLDHKNERWLRFEIELACSANDDAVQDTENRGNIGGEEVFNFALYDQSDPNNLFLATVDKAKFLRLQARQNLKIEQFSAFGCHFQSLLNHSIDQTEGGFICALKSTTKQTSLESEDPLLPGLSVQIFQGSCFRNLLHLELFFRKASDEEARLWISRKQVIAWGIINELSVEIEKLEAITVGDCDELQLMKIHMERTQKDHAQVLDQLVLSTKREAEKCAHESATELTNVKSAYESRIVHMESEYTEKIQNVESKLQSTKQELSQETQKLSQLNTEHLLSVQRSEEQASQLTVLHSQVDQITQVKESLAQQFSSKDKESLEHNMTCQKLTEQIQSVTQSLQEVRQEKDVCVSEKKDLISVVEQLRSQVQQLNSDKETLTEELSEKSKKIEKSKKKQEKTKHEKKEKKEKIKELEEEIEKADQRTEVVIQEREESNELLRHSKAEIEGQMSIINELKSKLTDAMDTLKKNSETIEFLNQSLTEAQKFSFRALLSSKQNVASGSVAAVATAVQRQSSGNHRITSEVKSDMQASALSRSRSRSPYCEQRRSSNSPLRLIQKQQQKSNLLLNANSFSSVKNEKKCCTTLNQTQHIRSNLRESIQESGVHALAKGCECKGYQAELKLTNKYAARFGMDEADQHHAAHNQYSSLSRHSGNNYMMHNNLNASTSNYRGGTEVQSQNQTYTSRSAVTYHAPSNAVNREITITAGAQTITSNGEAEDQAEGQTNNGQSQSSIGAVIMRGVPSQELRHQEEIGERKRDEKESHYSRHISSKASFGNQPNSYLMQQHQQTVGYQQRYSSNEDHSASIFGKQIVRHSVHNDNVAQSREQIVTMDRQEGEAIQTYVRAVQENNSEQPDGEETQRDGDSRQ